MDYHPPLIWIIDTNFKDIRSVNTDLDQIVQNHPNAIVLHTGNICEYIDSIYDSIDHMTYLYTDDHVYSLYYIWGLNDYRRYGNNRNNMYSLNDRKYIKLCEDI